MVIITESITFSCSRSGDPYSALKDAFIVVSMHLSLFPGEVLDLLVQQIIRESAYQQRLNIADHRVCNLIGTDIFRQLMKTNIGRPDLPTNLVGRSEILAPLRVLNPKDILQSAIAIISQIDFGP